MPEFGRDSAKIGPDPTESCPYLGSPGKLLDNLCAIVGRFRSPPGSPGVVAGEVWRAAFQQLSGNSIMSAISEPVPFGTRRLAWARSLHASSVHLGASRRSIPGQPETLKLGFLDKHRAAPILVHHRRLCGSRPTPDSPPASQQTQTSTPTPQPPPPFSVCGVRISDCVGVRLTARTFAAPVSLRSVPGIRPPPAEG